MINDKIQKQEAGDNSTNFQAQSIILNQGISYSDAKEIALEVYKANFLHLSQNAAQLARERAEELTDSFLKKLNAENSAAINSLQEPSMQAALYEAQKQYAKTGDKDLEGLLVDILAERAATSERNLRQIVLDEALSVAAKLTPEQMDALTINFVLTRTPYPRLVNLSDIPVYIETYLLPFTDRLVKDSSCYEHLEYAGCGSLLHIGELDSIEQIYQEAFGGLFCKGFSKKELEQSIGNPDRYSYLITSCLHNPSLLQIKAINTTTIGQICVKNDVPDAIRKNIIHLFISTRMSAIEIRDYLISVSPEIKKIFDLWEGSKLSKLIPTTVGIAIAQANLRRKTGIKLDLSNWVK